MNARKLFLRVLLIVEALMIIASAFAAFAAPVEPYLYVAHNAWVGLVSGKPIYNSAVFTGTELSLQAEDIMTQEMADVKVNMTISGGTVLAGGANESNAPWFSGEEHASGESYSLFAYPDDIGYEFGIYSDGRFSGNDGNEGLNNYSVAWESSNQDIVKSGTASISGVKTLQEQLNSFVPYVELTGSNGNVTGLTWRVVTPKDTSKTLTPADGLMRAKIRIVFNNGRRNYNSSWTSANPFEGTINDFEAFQESELRFIRVDLKFSENTVQRWVFYPIPFNPYLWISYQSEAALGADGKANYSNAKFAYFSLSPCVAGAARMTEAWHSAAGSLTISGGSGYSYGTSESRATAVTAPENSFKISPVYSSVGGFDKEWEIVNDSNEIIRFYDAAKSGAAFNNLSVKWEFPEAPELDGSATLPAFKTTAEQLASYVPYVELITSNNNVTGVKWRVVRPDAPDTALTGLNVNYFRLDAYDADENRISWIRANGGTGLNYYVNNPSVFEGTAQFSNSVNLTNLKRIRTRFTTTDGSESYEWSFVYDPSPSNQGDTPADQGDSSSDSSASSDISENSVSPSAPSVNLNDEEVVDEILDILKSQSSLLDDFTSNDVFSLYDDDSNVTIGSERNSADISSADMNTIGNAEHVNILPAMQVETPGVYVFGVQLSIPADTNIVFHALPKDSSYEISAASTEDDFNIASKTENAYVFLDDQGEETKVVPKNQHVNVAAYCAAGKYAPVIASEPVKNNSSKGSSSGCNAGTGSCVFALIALAGVFTAKRNKQ